MLIKPKTRKNDILSSGELIIQHNKLIEARYSLSLQEKKVILWLVSKIKAQDEEFKKYDLSIKEFSELTNASPNNLYKEMRLITKKLIQRVMEIKKDKNTLIQVAWLNSAVYHYKEGYVSLSFSPEMKPYLLQLKKEFTVVNISEIMGLSSFSAIRIYEILKQYETIGHRVINLQELRKACGIEQNEYPLYGNFKQKVLSISKKEINSKTDLFIDYEEIKTSRKVTSIKFIIKRNPNYGMTEFEKTLRTKGTTLQKEYRSELSLIESLIEYGFSKNISTKLIKNHGENIVRDALKSVDLQIERGKVKNAKAMLQMAIKERWKPEVYKNKKAKPC